MAKKLTITICCSVNFYRQAVEIEPKLVSCGFDVILPSTCTVMKTRNDYEVSHYKTWFANPGDYPRKTEVMLEHFASIIKGDAVLILNYEKHGQPGYIGGNVLMEMGLALQFKKPIFILNPMTPNSPFEEEILGMQPVFLNGSLELITETLKSKPKLKLIPVPDTFPA